MAGKNTAVFGLFPDESAADHCVLRLKEAGFRNTDVSALLPSNLGSKDLATEKDTKAPEGATTGGTTGVVVGGALGWLAGIGALAIPGVGPLIAAGPIMGLLAGAGVGAAVGGIAGALIGMGIPEYEAKRYEGMVRQGKVLLSVHCDNQDWVSRAKDIMEACGGQDVASAGEARADVEGTSTTRPMPRTTAAKGTDNFTTM